jgi:hypothetical protein
MMNDEYRQLVDFIGQHFAGVHSRFSEIDARFGQIDARFGQIDARFDDLEGRFDRFPQDVRAEFSEVKDLIRLGYVDLDRRVRRLEERG